MKGNPAKKLRTGFTTGAAAAAAAKAAVTLLMENKRVDGVQIDFLNGETTRIAVDQLKKTSDNSAMGIVIKDAGDDPDITHRAGIGAKVTLKKKAEDKANIVITGGQGVGIVTKPGLGIAVGSAAITNGPITMIRQSIGQVVDLEKINSCIEVEVFVPKGEELAKKTLNARLGVVGGISILGTTGIVYPMSHDAYIATIEKALSVAKAAGIDTVVLTTGRRSERFSQKQFSGFKEEAYILMGDFFKLSLETAAKTGFSNIVVAVFFGKAVKMSNRFPHTHAAKSELMLSTLSDWALECTNDKALCQKIKSANTARHVFDMVTGKHPELIEYVGVKMKQAATSFTGPGIDIHCLIYDYDGKVAFSSNQC